MKNIIASIKLLSNLNFLSIQGLNAVKFKTPHLYKGDKLIKITGTKVENLELLNFKEEFVPHGIDLMQVKKNEWLVFVVNHRSDQDYVEMFDWTLSNGLKLKHYKSVSVSDLGIQGNVNDVTIISRHSFYVSNDKFYNAAVGRTGHYLGIPFCKIVFWNNGNATDVSTGYVEPNGIARSPSGDRLFFTDPMSDAFYEFEINKKDGSLKLVDTLILPTSPDNINVISENEVLIGCHVRLHDLFIYFADTEKLRSPSHVIRVKRNDRNSAWGFETVFMDDGSLISGSSAGAFTADGNTLYVGTVVEKIAFCRYTTAQM